MNSLPQIDYFNRQESDAILLHIKYDKQKLINMIMIDCGLRVSESISLQYKNFDFKKRLLMVQSLKKRSFNVHRTIPISDRLYIELAEYISKQPNPQPDDYLFPSKRTGKHITRFAINKYLSRLGQKKNIKKLHPHAFRHSFATQHVSKGTPLENIKTMLGHSSYNTTLIYAHIPEELLRQNVESVTGTRTTFFSRLVKFFSPTPRARVINMSFNHGNVSIGRNDEITHITQNAESFTNTCIIGNIGTGKSHILSQITKYIDNQENPKQKVLKLDDINNVKKSLLNMLLFLYNGDKQPLFDIMCSKQDTNKAITRITRESTNNLCEEIIKITRPKEYIIMIDSIDNITNKGVQVLESFKDHFTIICAAREIKVDKSSFLWNFDLFRLQNLTRPNALELIRRLSYNLQIDDFELFKNHIYEQSDGNPRAIFEMVERYSKEPIIDNNSIREIRHIGARKEIDCSIVLLVSVAAVACLRYLNHEVENNSFRFIGGIAMVFLLVSRYFMRSTKQRNI